MDLDKLTYFNEQKTKEHLEKIRNGRVDIQGNLRTDSIFPMYAESNTGNGIYKHEALKSMANNKALGNASKFPLYQEINTGNATYKEEALKSILTHENETLHNVFFSKDNIDLLQNTIIKRIWIHSDKKYVIGRQSDRELKLIMRSVFLQYGKYNKNNIKKQIIELNRLIYKYCIPNILSNLQQFVTYKQDVNNLSVPLQHPENVSIKGTK